MADEQCSRSTVVADPLASNQFRENKISAFVFN